ncbi:MAG: hypothetical protein KatS3mg102_2644 [Planctomycetota bacterium]|nr:MAG: hypothetical protein KatS3mg102_2644 [Planctomycetota bacterium]
MGAERVLVVEDEALLLRSIADQLRAEGYEVQTAPAARHARQALGRQEFDLVLLDQRLPDGSGLDLMREILEHAPDTPVILMTAYSSVENAVEAMRQGAFDYLNKPFDLDELAIVVGKALETTRLRREVRLYTAVQRERFGLQRIVGTSPAMRELLRQVRRLIQSGTSTILIRGESGTGKDLLAKAIHHGAARPRAALRRGRLRAAMPESLLESELFGHERGAFTGAHARKPGLLEALAPGARSSWTRSGR